MAPVTEIADPMDKLEQRFLPLQLEGLTPEMVGKAQRELGETSDTRQEGLKEMRRMINGEKDFRPLMDDRFLLRFLRSRKMNSERAFAALCNYYTFKVRYSRVFTDFRPSEMKKVMDMNCLHILPHRDHDGCPIGIMRIERFDAFASSVDDLMSTALMGAEVGLQTEATQVCGVVIIMDLKGLGLKLVRQVASPAFLLRLVRAIQDCLPLRVKAIHVVNEPFYFSLVYNIIKRFLSEKIRNRFQLHGSKLKTLHEQVPFEILPEELGGSTGPMDNSNLKNKILDLDPHFVKINKYGYQEKRAQFIRKKSSMAIGLFM